MNIQSTSTTRPPPSKNTSVRNTPVASIERIKTKLGKKTVLKFPVRYAYFIPEYTKKKSKKNAEDVFEYDDRQVLLPIFVDLKTGESFEDESLLSLHEREAPPCSVAANSKDNPLKLEYSNKLRFSNAIEHISILEYKDTGNVTFTFIKQKKCWIRASGKVFNKETTIYKLTIRFGGKTTMTKNGVLCLTNKELTRVFMEILPLMRTKYIARYRGYVILKKMFIKYFLGVDKMSAAEFDRISYSRLNALYRVKQNAKLSDLPWDEEALASIYRSKLSLGSEYTEDVGEGERSVANVKVSLNRYLRRGDTKQAIEACFFGFTYPKSIKKVLLKTMPLEFKYKDYKNIAVVIERYGVDNARNLISNHDGTPNKDMIGNPHYIEMLELGFSLAQVAQYGRGYMKDTLSMRNRLLQEGHALEFIPNIREYHDYLMGLVIELDRERNEQRRAANAQQRAEWDIRNAERIKRRKRLELACLAVDTSEQVVCFEDNDFTFRSPTVAKELTKVGSSMNICVGMYIEDFFLGKLDIVLVTKVDVNGQEKYVACLEIRRKKLVQAKLNSNRKVNSNKQLMKSLKLWAVARDIKLASDDVGIRNCSYVEYNPINKERLAFLEDHELIDIN